MDEALEFTQMNEERRSINDGQVKNDNEDNNTLGNSVTDIVRKVLNITEVSCQR